MAIEAGRRTGLEPAPDEADRFDRFGEIARRRLARAAGRAPIAADIAPNVVGLSSPSTRTNGTLPAFRWRSLAPTSTVWRSSSVISTCLFTLPLVLPLIRGPGLDLLEVLTHLSARGQDL